MWGEDSGGQRPILTSVSGHDTVRVVLEYGDRRGVGECEVAGGGGMVAAAATATLQALDALTPTTVEFRLGWCEVVEPGDDQPSAVVVYATAIVDGVPTQLAGAALVHHELQVAAVRAALNATNRRLEALEWKS